MSAYALEPLLELRERSVEEANQVVGSAVDVVGRTEERCREISAEIARIRGLLAEQRMALDGPISGAKVAEMGDYKQGLSAEITEKSRQLTQAQTKLKAAQADLEQARQKQAESMAKLEVVEEHKAAWEADRRSIRARKAADELDEVAMRMWSKNHG